MVNCLKEERRAYPPRAQFGAVDLVDAPALVDGTARGLRIGSLWPVSIATW